MDKEKQIEEMAKAICRVKGSCNDVCNPIEDCRAFKYAERAYEAGYRKASDVAREIMKEVRQALLNMVLTNSMGENYDIEKRFAEIEKKYTEEGK